MAMDANAAARCAHQATAMSLGQNATTQNMWFLVESRLSGSTGFTGSTELSQRSSPAKGA